MKVDYSGLIDLDTATIRRQLDTLNADNARLCTDFENFAARHGAAMPQIVDRLVVSQLNTVLPEYLRLLALDLEQYGHEYIIEPHLFPSLIPGAARSSVKPLCQATDGTTYEDYGVYSLMQVAAAKCGIDDRHVGTWYGLLALCLRAEAVTNDMENIEWLH